MVAQLNIKPYDGHWRLDYRLVTPHDVSRVLMLLRRIQVTNITYSADGYTVTFTVCPHDLDAADWQANLVAFGYDVTIRQTFIVMRAFSESAA